MAVSNDFLDGFPNMSQTGRLTYGTDSLFSQEGQIILMAGRSGGNTDLSKGFMKRGTGSLDV